MSAYLRTKGPDSQKGKTSKKITQEEINKINQLWREGNTVGAIAKQMGRSPTLIEKHIGVRV